MKQIVLSLLVDNTPGVLSRIAGLFTRRGYNIDSISSGVTQTPKYTRITLVASGDDVILEQIQKQLMKLEDVVSIIQLEHADSVCRELLLVKVRANRQEKQELISIADVFRAKVVDVSKNSLIIELTGNVNKTSAFIQLLEGFDIVEMVRTGLTGLGRGSNIAKIE